MLTGEGHLGQVYELAGDRPFTMAELAAEVARQSGKKIRYRDLPEHEYAQNLSRIGVPEVMASMLVERDLAIARGEFVVTGGDLGRLVGRPTTTLAEAVSAALK